MALDKFIAELEYLEANRSEFKFREIADSRPCLCGHQTPKYSFEFINHEIVVSCCKSCIEAFDKTEVKKAKDAEKLKCGNYRKCARCDKLKNISNDCTIFYDTYLCCNCRKHVQGLDCIVCSKYTDPDPVAITDEHFTKQKTGRLIWHNFFKRAYSICTHCDTKKIPQCDRCNMPMKNGECNCTIKLCDDCHCFYDIGNLAGGGRWATSCKRCQINKAERTVKNKTCLICSHPFETFTNKQIYCSPDCALIARKRSKT